jgi:uncharacterized protein YndB with AHSA1/START domain
MRLIAFALALAAPAAHAQTVTTQGDGSRTLTVEALVPAGPDAVWQSVSTAEGWKSWAVPVAWLSGDVLETSYIPSARPGDAGNIQQRFLERVPGHTLVFRTIRTPEGFPHAQAFMGVTHFLLLLPEAGGTRVRLTDKGYPAGPAGDELLGFFKTGNQETLDHLAARFGLAPLEFLAGHCWRATRDEGVDTHCFKADGATVRDHHEVVADGKTVYHGDTVYSWDPAAKATGYVYTSPAGGMSGHVAPTANGLDFGMSFFQFEPVTPSNDLTRSTRGIHIRTTWTRVGDSAYDVIEDVREKNAPAVPIRYARIH